MKYRQLDLFEEEPWKLKLRDFKPVTGYWQYNARNHVDNETLSGENADERIMIRAAFLQMYNIIVSLATPTLIGVGLGKLL